MKSMTRTAAPALALAALLGACAPDEPVTGARRAGFAAVLACWENALVSGTIILRPNRIEVGCGEIGEGEAPAAGSAEEPSRPTRVVSR
jgi:hypothetical protein